jgi:hypothetical protein
MYARRALRAMPLVLSLVLVGSLITIRSGARSGLAASGGVATQVTPQSLAALPLGFELNRGQTDRQVRFLAHDGRVTLFLTSTEAVLASGVAKGRESVVRLQPAGAARVQPTGVDELPGKVNYLIGGHHWTNIPTYARVVYRNVYPHIDLAYYGRRGQLEYDWVLHPGARAAAIDLHIAGADRVSVDSHGNLDLHAGGAVLRQAKPTLYQVIGGARRAVAGRYELVGARDVRIEVGSYDAATSLVVDPVLSYVTLIGGNNNDTGESIAVDALGDAFVAGHTESTSLFPRVNARQSSNAGFSDAFITEVSADGNSFVYSTYLGGNGTDEAHGIAVDAGGNAYVAGFTNSSDFPAAPSGSQATHGGSYDIFAVKLDPTGAKLVYSTLLGGTKQDYGWGIAIDGSGDAFIAGESNSPPATNFLARMDALYPNGSPASSLNYGSASGDNGAYAITVDNLGNVWETGYSKADSFPTANSPVQSTYQGGFEDAFVTEIQGALTQPTPSPAIAYSTYLGSPGTDVGAGIAVDGSNNVYVTGWTNSAHNFPVVNAFQSSNNGGYDAFIAKFTSGAHPARAWSTYYGGGGDDYGTAVAVDGAGDAIVVGYTKSTNLSVPGATQAANAGGEDAFVAKINPSGSGLIYGTYLGGTGDDEANGVARDLNGYAYVTGSTGSATDFSTTGSAQTANNGGLDAFAAKITDVSGIPTITPTSTVTATATSTATATATSAVTATATRTATPTTTTQATATLTATATFTPTATATVPTNTPTPTSTPLPTSTSTPVPPPKPPKKPKITISPGTPMGGQNFKITVDTSPGASVDVTVKVQVNVTVKVNGSKKTKKKTVYELDLSGKARGNGRFGRTRKLNYYPAKPTTATVTAKARTAGGTKTATKTFTIQPYKKG